MANSALAYSVLKYKNIYIIEKWNIMHFTPEQVFRRNQKKLSRTETKRKCHQTPVICTFV